MSQFFKKNWKRFLAVIILVVLIVVIVDGKKDVVMATHTVARQDVSDTLVLSGKVEPVDRVEMAFAGSGIIDGVFKKNGDTVRAGERIVELDNASLRADLADITAGSVNKEQDLLVANARKRLLNDDLAAYLVSSGDDDLSATVTGSYQSLEEGTYYLRAYASAAESGFSLQITGLENTSASVNFNSPVAVGKRGLFIQFNNTDTSYMGSSWVIEIPNKRGSNYISNLNAYESAQKTRDIEVAQTSARVAGIQADIESRTLRAPFNGVVSKVEARKGEIAGAGEVMATIISKDNFRVKVQVPEVDIVNLLPGLVADITLDAYGSEVVFPAKVISVDQSETKVDGVSVYEADVLFDTADPRILSGLSANVSILKSKKEAALCVPARFIDKDGSQEFVLVQNLANETNDKTFVTTGIKGSDGCVEILSGLNEGDVVVGDFEK